MEQSRRYCRQRAGGAPETPAEHQLLPRSEPRMFSAVLVLVMLVLVPLLSIRYGVDSRRFATRERRSDW